MPGRELVVRLLGAMRGEGLEWFHAAVLGDDVFALSALRCRGKLQTELSWGVYSVTVELRPA